MLVKLHEDLALSRITAGVMNWGKWGADLSSKDVNKLIRECIKLGITTFDHADIYGHYTTEKLFGDAMALGGIDRSKIQIITKCGIKLPCDNRPKNKIISYNNSGAYIFDSVHKSLENFKTDYIDLLLIHRPSPLLDPHVVAGAFLRLKNQGKVRHFGVSNFDPIKFNLIYKSVPVVTNQIEASILHLDPFMDGTLDNAMSRGSKPMAWSPLGGGQLFKKSKDYDFVMKRGRLKDAADKNGWTLEEMAYKFLLHHPSQILPVTGSSKIERIKIAVDAMKEKISDEQWFEILKASAGTDVP
ncbi:MAG: aldo/keto reductase [Saprospiraceae bacterium]